MILLCLYSMIQAQNELDSLRLVSKVSKGKDKVNTLNAIASRLQTISPDEALRVVAEARALSKVIKYPLGEVDAMSVKATVYSLQQKYAEADILIDSTLNLLKAHPDSKRLANIYLLISTHKGRQNRFNEAVENALKGLNISRGLKDKAGQANFLLNIGYNYEILGNLEEAEQHFIQASQLYQEVGDKYRLGQLYINLGVLEFKKHNLGLSIDYNQRALMIFQEEKDNAHMALSLQNLGFAHWQLKQNGKALEYYRQSEVLLEKVGNTFGLGNLMLNKAKIYADMSQPQKVLEATGQALKMADRIQQKILFRDVYAFLHEYHLQRDEFEQALIQYKNFIQIKDSLNLEESNRKIAKIEAQFNLKELSDQNRSQIQTNQIKSLQIRQRNLFIGGLMILLTISVWITYFQRRRMKTKLLLREKDHLLAQKEIELANTRLSSFAEQLSKKDEILQLTKEELLKQKSQTPEAKKQITHFIDELNISLGQKDWVKFKLQFEAVYPDFFEKLQNLDSKLGRNDDRLAAMIRIKLSNKEIATALSINPESVGRAKHRFKQRLGLEPDQNLEEYLGQF